MPLASRLPGNIRGLISPGKEALEPKELRGYLRDKGVVMDADGELSKLVSGHRKAVLKRKRRGNMPDSARGRYALASLTAAHTDSVCALPYARRLRCPHRHSHCQVRRFGDVPR